MSPLQEFAVLRACQEALMNVLVHLHATVVEVRLTVTDEDGVLTVEDDGASGRTSGEPPASTASGGGSGIPGMRERANAVGGAVTADLSPRGWRVRLVLSAAGLGS